MSGFDVYEKRTRLGYSLHINLRDPANSVVVVPFQKEGRFSDLAGISEKFESMGYSCSTNFKSERLVCVR